MIQKPNSRSSQSVKVLSENEIQERLYGEVLGRRRKTFSKPTEPIPSSFSKDAEWTGAEILTSELKRLRNDLITLRKERERLAAELEHHVHPSPAASSVLNVGGSQSLKSAPWGELLRKLTVALILAACLGMPLGFRLLQASPVGSEPSPYTVQVAVYDVKPAAVQALARLQDMGYSAFFVEYPRRDGRARYRIYVGRFVTKTEAELERGRLTSDPRFCDAFVRLQ